MGQRDRRIDVRLQKMTAWQAECAVLRDLLLETELDEAFKWREAAYTLNGEVVAMISHRKANCGIAFFRGALLSDPEKVLEAPGPNSQASRELKFTSLAEIEASQDLIRAYVAEAIQIHRDGRKVDFKAKDELVLPEELIEVLADDAELSHAWDALTPGRKRSWILHISSAKQQKTKHARIEKGRAKIMSGKGQLER